MDLFAAINYIDLHSVGDLKTLHPLLTKKESLSQLHLLETDGKMYGGFNVLRR
ncbi:MAG: hypothetical protein IH819_10540, partial [Bacteroidetes bacterium]|nr:hypothetical protein [Bacteroidota bacterium]